MAKKDEELLQEIRDRYKYAFDAWKVIRDEANIDMRYVAGDPWSEKDKKQRADAGRPALSCDELNQYINQANNNLRQNPRGIKIEPAGQGSSEKTAEFRQNLIRGIEYRSSAQRAAYTPAAENAMQRSYGFFRISREYAGKGFDQEICIKGILNPDSVLYDPDVKEADWSDANFCFVVEPLLKSEFLRLYPRAEVRDFASYESAAPEWIQENHVMRGEYWKATTKSRTLLLIKGQDEPVFEDELEGSRSKYEVLNEREYNDRQITQYMTNGVEILGKPKEQPGPYIPIVPVIGKEMYLNEGGTAKRVLFSMVRLARDPQMAYAYLWSQEAEEAKMTPKAPFEGYVGQFETDKEAWDSLTDVPRAYIQVDPVVDGAGNLLPLPTRPAFTPNFQGYEVAKESAKRAIQAAIGGAPLPTTAQKDREKSGVALDKIQNEQAVGSFHFMDNFERSLILAGKIIESWIPVVYDTEREVGIQKEDGSHHVVRINTKEPYTDEKGVQHHYPVADTEEADHLVTISTGPSHDSQRQEAAEFADTLIQNLTQLPIPPQAQARLLAMAIKLRQIGPLGDQMVSIIEGDPNDQAQKAQQAAQQLQQAQAQLQLMQQEISKLTLDKEAKTVEQAGKKALLQIEKDFERWKLEVTLDNARAIAEIQTQAQILSERQEQIHETNLELHGAAHELGLQKDQQSHEAGMAVQAQQAAAEQAANQPEASPGA